MQAIALLMLVIAHNLHSAHTADDDDIPEPCRHLTYCTIKPANYPEAKFNDLLKGYKTLPQPEPIPEIEFANRVTDEIDKDNCLTVVTHEPIYKARETRDTVWKTVIQAPGANYQQRIRLESCENHNAKCFTAFAGRTEISSTCQQRYVTMALLVEEPNNKTETIKIELPICCSCRYKELSFANRFGLSNKT